MSSHFFCRLALLLGFGTFFVPVAFSSAAEKCDPRNPPGPYQIENPNKGLKAERGDPGCPPGMVLIDGFCMDKYEASLVYTDSKGKKQFWSPYHNPGKLRVKAVSLAGAVPQAYISGVQAETACANAGKRLCTDEEFLRACRGPRNHVYPYADVRYPTGSSSKDPFCNEARSTHPAKEIFVQEKQAFSHLDNACINQLEHSVARTGSFLRCKSDDGVYDLMGNLHEWVGAPDKKKGKGRFRGGYYADTRVNGEGCLYVTHAHNFTYWDYSTGFRCCADVRMRNEAQY